MPNRRLLASLGLVGLSTLFALVLFEGALRVIYPAPITFKFPQEYYDFDPEIAHALRPGQEAYTHHQPVKVNSKGFRDAEYTPQPAPGVTRLLAFGDSQTFGNGLALEDTWPKQLERDLAESTGREFEVINGGIPGTDTWQHEVVLQRMIDAYQADAAILALYVNDISPSYEPTAFDPSELTNSWKKRVVYLAKRSLLVSMLHTRIRILKGMMSDQKGGSYEQYTMSGEPNDLVDRGWVTVEKSLAKMKALCDEQGMEFVVAILPRRDQVTGATPGRVYNQRSAEIGARVGFETIDLLPALEAAYDEHGQALFIPWDGHNSAIANRLVSGHLVPRLQSLGSPVATR